MHRPTTTILLTLLLACGTVQASDWVSVVKSDNGVREYFADVSSIGITGEIRRARIKIIVPPDKPFSLDRMAFNCREGTMEWPTTVAAHAL